VKVGHGVIIIMVAMRNPRPFCYPPRFVRQRGGVFIRFLAVLMALVVTAAAAGWWWLTQPLPLSGPTVEYSVEAGSSPREVARGWGDAGVQTSPWVLYQWFRWSGQSRQIKAGNYELRQGASARDLLRMMVQGDESLARVKLIEGWTFQRWREELAKAEDLQPTTRDWSPQQIMNALGMPGVPAEGRFFPDTYAYAKGNTDLAVMQRALHAMQKHLDAAWAQRDRQTPLKSADEALILASIVEKETGQEADRPMIAGVFTNRLRIDMPLQTDPTVIYGLGTAFDGNLRRVDLRTDTPFNTYTRRGLPPSPIAMPGKAALMASVQPAQTPALYFVARGDGTTTFSATLAEHNRAVNLYQRKVRTQP
jgi:UPF0755 protein